jgi:hypothetical protein
VSGVRRDDERSHAVGGARQSRRGGHRRFADAALPAVQHVLRGSCPDLLDRLHVEAPVDRVRAELTLDGLHLGSVLKFGCVGIGHISAGRRRLVYPSVPRFRRDGPWGSTVRPSQRKRMAECETIVGIGEIPAESTVPAGGRSHE